MDYTCIRTETTGAVGLVVLDRPKVLNALNQALIDELGNALAGFDADDAIGAMVVTGSEKAFAAGADISEMADKDSMDMFTARHFEGWDRIEKVRKPVIAAVAGYALGGGCELAMACDIVIAADNARFGQPEIKLGVPPGLGGTQRLPRVAGKAKAMDMCLTARMMDADEAERSGLASRVVPLDRLLDEAMEAASVIASMSRPAVLMVKEAIDRAYETTLESGLDAERGLFNMSFSHRGQARGHACVPREAASAVEASVTGGRHWSGPGALRILRSRGRGGNLRSRHPRSTGHAARPGGPMTLPRNTEGAAIWRR